MGLNLVSQSLQPNTSLVEVLIQLGPDITNNAEVIRGLLERFGITEANPPRDSQVIEIITTLSRLAGEGAVICDVGALVRALVSYVSRLHNRHLPRVSDGICVNRTCL